MRNSIIKVSIYISLLAFGLSCKLEQNSLSADVTIIPSQTSGVGPLMVHFLAEYPAQADPAVWFHKYEYIWDFSDPASGVWGTNGLSKNSAKGAVTAHVFETPGQYIINVTVKESGMVIATNSVAVSVLDPDVFYAGTKTTCVNPGGDDDFSEAPAGSRNISTDDISTITRFATAGSRILFKRGGEWTTQALTNWPENAGPVTIGAYGTGDNPKMICMGGGTFLNFSDKQNWRIMDLTFINNDKTGSAIGGSSAFERITLIRISTDGFAYPISWGNYNHSLVFVPDLMAVVDCTIRNAASMGLYVGSERLAILGTIVAGADESHVARIWQGYKTVISNNMISGSSLTTDTGRHALKFHCSPIQEININPRPNSTDLRYGSEYAIISDNVFGSSGPWPVSIGPTDAWTDQRITNIIFERNRYCGDYGQRSPSSNSLMISLRIHARQITVRNNIFDTSNFGNEITGITIIGSEETAPASKNIWIYNNTIYKSGNPNGVPWVGININSGAENVIVRNNLVSFPYTNSGHAALRNQGTGTIQANNLLNGAVSFINPDNSNPLARSFALESGSTDAINQGYLVPAVFEDFTGKARPLGGSYDIGAHEY